MGPRFVLVQSFAPSSPRKCSRPNLYHLVLSTTTYNTLSYSLERYHTSIAARVLVLANRLIGNQAGLPSTLSLSTITENTLRRRIEPNRQRHHPSSLAATPALVCQVYSTARTPPASASLSLSTTCSPIILIGNQRLFELATEPLAITLQP